MCRKAGDLVYLVECATGMQFPRLGSDGKQRSAQIIRYTARFESSPEVERDQYTTDQFYNTTHVTREVMESVVTRGNVHLWKFSDIKPLSPPLMIPSCGGQVWIHFHMPNDTLPILHDLQAAEIPSQPQAMQSPGSVPLQGITNPDYDTIAGDTNLSANFLVNAYIIGSSCAADVPVERNIDGASVGSPSSTSAQLIFRLTALACQPPQDQLFLPCFALPCLACPAPFSCPALPCPALSCLP